MNTIKFNDFECEIVSFNKNTYYNNGVVSGNVNCELITTDIDGLHALSESNITSITITHNEDVIYNVTHFTGQLSSVSESLADDHIIINIMLVIS